MRQVPFQQVDVFTNVPFKGNPVAVVMEGDGLSSEEMQAIANWTNLSETTFVCTPGDPQADYKLRIFTPFSELPFAGHPTIGSAHAVLKRGLKPKLPGRLVQECGKGLVTVWSEGDRLFLNLPEPQLRELGEVEAEALADALGITLEQIQARAAVDVGAVWMTLQLTDARVVLALRPNMEKLAALIPMGVTGVTVFGFPSAAGAEVDVEVRSFAPTQGIPEDPVCGSGNGCVAALVRELGLLGGANYSAGQGSCVGRNGRVEVRYQDGEILVGGHAVTCIEGVIRV